MNPLSFLQPVLGFFVPGKYDSPCVGLELGRGALWAAYGREKPGEVELDWSHRFPLDESDPKQGTKAGALDSALDHLCEKLPASYYNLQVALPDPSVQFEVFELDKMPPPGRPLTEFLAWRFNQERDPALPALAFTSQSLGQEDGKYHLLAAAMERNQLDLLEQSLGNKGLYPSAVDMALAYRFNYFHGAFQGKGAGGLITFEPDYWSLALWDQALRPRFARSKWWKKELVQPKEIPLEQTVLEIERTIRSYVYSGKDRSVETLYVSAPAEWLDPVLKALNKKTGGRCVGLPSVKTSQGKAAGITPPSAAAAVASR